MFTQPTTKAPWIPIYQSISFMFTNRKVFSWSLLLITCTIVITALSYHFMTGYIDNVSKNFFTVASDQGNWWQLVKEFLFTGIGWIYHLGTHILCFYISFLLSYSLTSPGYCFLSQAAEKIYAGKFFDPEAAFSIRGTLLDLWEGVKIALFGIVITFIAFFLNFIPIIGQLAVIAIYTLYSTMIFIDYPASKRRWSLAQKISWIKKHLLPSLRLGILPALVTFIPIINIFILATLFPIMTVHATLNFMAIETAERR